MGVPPVRAGLGGVPLKAKPPSGPVVTLGSTTGASPAAARLTRSTSPGSAAPATVPRRPDSVVLLPG